MRLLIIWYLSKENLHGYLIMKKINKFFEKQIKLGLIGKIHASKMYPILKEMEKEGIIISYSGIHNNKQVKMYKITEKGYKTVRTIKQSFQKDMRTEPWKSFIDDLTKN